MFLSMDDGTFKIIRVFVVCGLDHITVCPKNEFLNFRRFGGYAISFTFVPTFHVRKISKKCGTFPENEPPWARKTGAIENKHYTVLANQRGIQKHETERKRTTKTCLESRS